MIPTNLQPYNYIVLLPSMLVYEWNYFTSIILESYHSIHEDEALRVSIERELCFNSNSNTPRVTDVNKLNILESLKSVRNNKEHMLMTCNKPWVAIRSQRIFIQDSKQIYYQKYAMLVDNLWLHIYCSIYIIWVILYIVVLRISRSSLDYISVAFAPIDFPFCQFH